ncbi:MAG: peptidase [Cyanobacteria bacterium RYN_339]|nr:peptidase [Cyanobacteria bacterium RYN_339]
MRLFWGVLASATLALSGCGAVAQVAVGALPAFLIGDAQEIELGKQGAAQVIATTPVYQDNTAQAYVQTVGTAVATVSDRPDLHYYYTILVDPEPNAFALPGGFVFITTSLLKIITNEAQLAGVLAHETGHVAARHSIQLIRQAAIAQGVEAAVLGQNAGQTQIVIGNVITQLLLKGYGRDKEYDADRLGAIYATRAGYDPNQLPTFLDLLERATGSQPGWVSLLADHPSTADRIKALVAQITNGHLAGSKEGADAFLRATAALR